MRLTCPLERSFEAFTVDKIEDSRRAGLMAEATSSAQAPQPSTASLGSTLEHHCGQSAPPPPPPLPAAPTAPAARPPPPPVNPIDALGAAQAAAAEKASRGLAASAVAPVSVPSASTVPALKRPREKSPNEKKKPKPSRMPTHGEIYVSRHRKVYNVTFKTVLKGHAKIREVSHPHHPPTPQPPHHQDHHIRSQPISAYRNRHQHHYLLHLPTYPHTHAHTHDRPAVKSAQTPSGRETPEERVLRPSGEATRRPGGVGSEGDLRPEEGRD